MKKKVLFAAGAMIIAAAVSAAVCLNFGQTRHDDLFEQNLDALARGENDLDKCNGCNTEDEIICCHLVIINHGGYFLYRD